MTPGNAKRLGDALAVLSAPGFDATSLDPADPSLARSPVTRRRGGGMASFEDVNGDTHAAPVVGVPKKFLRLKYDSTEAMLRGMSGKGRFLQGADRVQIGDKSTMTFDSDSSRPAQSQSGPEFVQTAGITLNDLSPATPYPSTITVSGVTGIVSKVRVTLKGLAHTFPR